MKLWVALAVLAALTPSIAEARKFAGFSADGTRVLLDKDVVCTPPAARADGSIVDPFACEQTDKATVKAHKFKLPAKAKQTLDGQLKLSAKLDAIGLVTISGTDARKTVTVLASFDPGKGNYVTAVKGPFLSKAGNVVAVEYTYKTDDSKKKLTEAVAFEISVPLAGAAPVPGSAAARVLEHGGKWKQQMLACETAGVAMLVRRNHSFTITIDTRCQGMRDHLVVGGVWDAKDPDQIILTFDNANADSETTKVTLAKCPDSDEECLSWKEDEVTFLLLPAS